MLIKMHIFQTPAPRYLIKQDYQNRDLYISLWMNPDLELNNYLIRLHYTKIT